MKNITFINAGAGSGKTYSLTEALYKNIAEGICHADQVLLTTFTKKAAEEIKQRAHAKLIAEQRTDDAILLQNAYMGTVHSVGYKLIKKYCYLLGLSPNIKELSTEDTDFYFSQAISTIPLTKDLERLGELSKLFQFQKDNDNFVSELDENKWKDQVLEIVSKSRSNDISDLSETGLSFCKSIAFIQQVFEIKEESKIDHSKIWADLKELYAYVENLPDKGNGGRKKTVLDLKIKLNKDGLTYSYFIDIQAVAVDILKKDPSNKAAGNLLSVLDMFYHTQSFQDTLKEYTSLVFKIAHQCIDAFSIYKKSYGLVDYADMETYFLELLNIPEIQADIKERIKVVMVDEFQDSNPIQLSIFIKLSEIVDKSIWVGDPKQAIYGFNGSDPLLVSGILTAFYKQNENGLKVQLLKKSYRSRPDLVNLSNGIFEASLEDQAVEMVIERENVLGHQEFPEWMKQKFGAEKQITLAAQDTIGLIPNRSDIKDGFETAAVNHWHFSNDFKGAGNDEQYSYYLANKVKTILDSQLPVYDKDKKQIRTLVPSDVAILCRTKREIAKIAATLMGQGVEVAAQTEGLLLTAEYRLLINILNYIADSRNSLAITELLLLVNNDPEVSPQNLLEQRLDFMSKVPSNDTESGKAYYEYISQWGKDHSFIKELDLFLKEAGHLSVPELVEKAIVQLNLSRYISAWENAEQRMANLYLMANYAKSYDDYCLKLNLATSLVGFVQWMQSGKERGLQAASSNKNAVNVMTYHRSKGLEFPYLILSSLNTDHNDNTLKKNFFRTTVKTDNALDVNQPLKDRYINFAFWPFGAKETIMGYEEIIKESEAFLQSEKSRIQEIKRLLYVGLTRSRDYLVTTSFKKKEPHWLNLVNDKNSSWNLKEAVLADAKSFDMYGFGIPVNCQRIHDDRPEFDTTGEELLRNSCHYYHLSGGRSYDLPKFLLPSYRAGSNKVQVQMAKDFSHRIVLNGKVEEAEMGNCLHDILYLMEGGLDEPKVSAIIDNFNMGGRLNAESVLTSVRNLKSHIDDLKPLKIHRELSLSVYRGLPVEQKNGYVYNGAADLVLEFADGLHLIDYKSYPGKTEEVLNPDSKHFAGIYSGQLDAYTFMLEKAFGKKVLKKMIYYSVLGKLVEVE